MKTSSLFLAGLMACIVIGMSTASGQTYRVTDLGIVPDMTDSQSGAINNQGRATGMGYAESGTCAFFYAKAVIQDAGGVNSRGFGINSSNLVAGDAYFGQNILNPSHAALFRGSEETGVVTDLGALPGHLYSRANGINSIGWVVGFSGPERDSSYSRAFVWSKPTGMIDMGTLGGPYAQAYAINDAGWVTGTSMTMAMTGGTHAFMYQPLVTTDGFQKPMQDLGSLIGLSGTSYGMAINNSNHVAGYSTINLVDNRVHGFLYDGENMIDLGALDRNPLYGDTSVALAVNNSDEVVGYSHIAAGKNQPIRQAAFIWIPQRNIVVAHMKNLNDMIGSASQDYWLYSATGINDKGQIVASAYDMNGIGRALLLTPREP